MPTRYTVDLTLEKTTIKDLKDPMKRKKARFQAKVKFEERYVLILRVSCCEKTLSHGANAELFYLIIISLSSALYRVANVLMHSVV